MTQFSDRLTDWLLSWRFYRVVGIYVRASHWLLWLRLRLARTDAAKARLVYADTGGYRSCLGSVKCARCTAKPYKWGWVELPCEKGCVFPPREAVHSLWGIPPETDDYTPRLSPDYDYELGDICGMRVLLKRRKQ